MALSKHIKRSNLEQKIFELHAWVKSAILAIFQKGLGWPCPVSVSPQKCIIAFEKFFLFWVPMNTSDWKAKLESAYSFMLKHSKTTVCGTVYCALTRQLFQVQTIKSGLLSPRRV